MIYPIKTRLMTSAAATIVGIAAISTPALAQRTTDSVAPANSAATSDESIVVTGSRIRKENFDTASPINVITREDRVLAGARTTAAILQSSSITSGTSQINGSFLGFVSENGPAAESVGLRGMGSSRTLVLLNGRRLAPSGVGPQLVAADLNTLPTAIVSRIEILREGASSVYGSDAIAGVVNVITDTKIDGVTFDAFTDQPTQHGGGGRVYRTSVVAGKTFDRGHITASLEYRQTTGLRLADRNSYSCPRDLYYNPTTGQEVGMIDPATGQLMCFPFALSGNNGTASGYGIAIGFTGNFNRVTYDNGDINSLRNVNGITRTSPNPQQLQKHVLSPVKTYTAYLNGAYELGLLGDAEIYSEALFTRRTSLQDDTYQINIDPQQLSPRIEIYGGTYAGVPLSDFGYPSSPFFPNSLAAAGYNYFTPFIIPNRSYRSSQRIDFIRANAGLRGNLGLGDWRYDANFQYSHTKARQNIGLIEAPLLSNALQTVIAPPGTPENLITRPVAGQAGFGNAYTCASNVANGALISGASCVPLNLYSPDIMIGGALPDNVYNYIFRPQINRTTFTETIATLNFDGSLFTLPGGPVQAAVGYEHRHNKINDVPSPAQQDGSLYNYSSGDITKGSDTVDEVYGEVNLPFLADRPWVKLLELSASGRYTHYKSYGSGWTYRLNGQWAVNDIVKFRAAYGTAYRAPNLYEQFVADQTGFYGGDVDPCNDFANVQDSSTNIYKNCLAELTGILGQEGALNYLATSGPEVVTRGGAGFLKSEKSRSYGFGVVLSTPPTSPLDVSLAVDYWNVRLKGEVAVLNNLILDRCYEADDFPNNQYCALISPRRPASDPQKGTLDTFLNPYINVAQRAASGIDFDFRLATPINDGKFVLRARATRNLHQYYQEFEEDEKTDYNGTLGTQNFPGGPKWVANADLEYTFPGDKVTLHYGVRYVGKQDSTEDAGDAVAPLGVGPVNVDLVAETYWEHGAAVQVKIEDVGEITLGVNNLFNTKPPRISAFPTSAGSFTRIGNYFNSSNYNLVGRSVFLNVTRTFR